MQLGQPNLRAPLLDIVFTWCPIKTAVLAGEGRVGKFVWFGCSSEDVSAGSASSRFAGRGFVAQEQRVQQV